MARHSILTPARPKRHQQPDATPPDTASSVSATSPTTRPSRIAKLHLGGYFEPHDATVIAFQKLRVDLRKSQQEMLMEAMADFVAKYQAVHAFKE